MVDHTTTQKMASLEEVLSGFDALLVAFSGGVDSALLLAVAAKALKQRAVAATFASPIHPRRETENAIRMAEALGVSHRLITAEKIAPPELLENGRNRCYHCKKALGERLRTVANELQISTIAHGANLDDLTDFRPGFRAAREMGWVAPLMDAGLTKAEIRSLSKEMGLSTWDRPAMACLATRIPYGTSLTTEALKMIDGAEDALLDLGIEGCRVRHYGDTARIELSPGDLDMVLEKQLREQITEKFRNLGFLHVAVDLEGYKQGKMNRRPPN